MSASAPAPLRGSTPGPAGPLEVLCEPGTGAALAVLCHPHPLYGGTLDNKVVHTLARAARQCGAHAVRFNFRGVGASAGVHDGGAGEVDDLRTVVAWARERYPGLPLHVAGFSFGAAVALMGANTLDAASVLVVAPPVERLAVPAAGTLHPPLAIIHGDADTLVALQATQRWAAPRPVQVISGADHFFHGHLGLLKQAAVGFWQPLIARA